MTIQFAVEEAQQYVERAKASPLSHEEEWTLSWAEIVNGQADPSFERLPVGGTFYAQRGEKTDEGRLQIPRLARLVMKEAYAALCKDDERYRKAAAEAGHNVTLLIGAIAAHLSGSLGFSTLIVAAVAASVMRLVAAVGRNALCEYGRAHLEGDDEG